MCQPSDTDQVLIRTIQLADAEDAAELCDELGYPTEVEVIKERIGQLTSSADSVVYVACTSNRVIGWIDVAIRHHLATGSYGEIGGFIVSSRHAATV